MFRSPTYALRQFLYRNLETRRLFAFHMNTLLRNNRELKQPRRQRQQETYKLAYLKMKTGSIFLGFVRAFFNFITFHSCYRPLTTQWNDVFCRCVDDVSTWPQIFNFVFFSLKRWFQFQFQGAVSPKSRKLFRPEKPFVKLRSAYSVMLVWYLVKGIKTKITAKFRASRRLRFEDAKIIMSPKVSGLSRNGPQDT